jgi:biopolymer transport protein ExbD
VIPACTASAPADSDADRGDRTADYGTVMRVMARISSAGYRNLGLVTLQEKEN